MKGGSKEEHGRRSGTRKDSGSAEWVDGGDPQGPDGDGDIGLVRWPANNDKTPRRSDSGYRADRARDIKI